MKMILLVRRDTQNQILYEPYMTNVLDETGRERYSVWKSDNDDEVHAKLKELIAIYPSNKIILVEDQTWIVDVILGD